MTEFRSALKRALKLRDLILLNIVAVYTPSTISQTMQLGSAGLLVWAAAILAFMLPYAAAIAELSSAHPREGGIYAWTRMAFGEFHGFVCGWCYWVNTFLYVPSVFLGIVAVAALAGGDRTAWLNDYPWVVTLIAGSAVWIAAWLHIAGLGQGKWIQNIGAFGRLAMAAAIVIAAVWKIGAGIPGDPAVESAPSPLGIWSAMALWPFALNALVGLDLGSAMSEEADAPRRDIPRSLLTGGVAVAACYLLTYGAVMLIAIGEPSAIYGHVASVNSVIAQSGTDRSLAWLASAIVLVELAGLMGSGAAWLSAPARIPFAIGIDRYLPNIFARVHPRFGTPYMALIVQAIAATALIFANTYGATLQDAYLVLVGGSIVLVMVPYLYLLAAWMKLTASSSVAIRRVKLLGATGSVATCAAIAACFIPPPLVEGVLGFEVKLIGSVGFMLACGLAAYKLGARRGAKFSASRQSTDNSSMP